MNATRAFGRRALRRVFLLGPLALSSACAHREQPVVAMSAPALVDPELIFDRSFEVFDRAIFYKPREPQDVEFDLTLAPLIVQELPHTSETVTDISPYPISRGHRERQPSTAPSVIVLPSSVRQRTRDATGEFFENDYKVTNFLWRHPGSRKLGKHMIPEARGVRIISSIDGVPLIWQALDSRGGLTVLFVSKIVEEAAAEQFGQPLPGRRYSIEKSLEDAPHVVVARVVADGPVPMGPYVYVAGEDHTITAVLCRCMPSQVNEFIETRYYELHEAIPVFSEYTLLEKQKPRSRELNPEWYMVSDHVAVLGELRWPRLPLDRPCGSTASASSP